MSTAALEAPEYAFSYVGAPATDGAKLKSLKLAGPLLLAKQHKVIELLPDAFDDTAHAPKVQTTQIDMHEMLMGGSLFDADKDGWDLWSCLRSQCEAPQAGFVTDETRPWCLTLSQEVSNAKQLYEDQYFNHQ